MVIVDEEQRFGVEHKEQLKTLRASVDVLTMSATPIPRTLEMAITGIREMSTIATPPEERHPVLTFVGAHDDKQVAAAIHRELLRDGQVFYLHNRVESIDKAARRLRELVPEARIAVAHGQMGEEALEKVMVGFWEKEFDVLVCTTIVEVRHRHPERQHPHRRAADLLGLSQLHQIRGRVGPGRERAYAYFLYPREKPLTETAHERLATIAQHTELGAGMYVAMKDLEIRGAGNLLGGEQSGHIEGVGFDLYVRMVGEAVPRSRASGPRRSRGQGRPADRRAPADRVHRGGTAAPGDVPQARRGPRRRPPGRGGGRDDRPLRRAAGPRGQPDRGGPVPAGGPRVRPHRRLVQGKHLRFSPLPLPDSKQLRLKRYHPDAVYKPTSQQVSVPRPATRRMGGEALRDQALLEWCAQLLRDVLGDGSRGVRGLARRCRERVVTMYRARRLATVALAASLAAAGLAGCRSAPSVAAYVGQNRISEDRVSAVYDDARDNAVTPAGDQQAASAIRRQDVVDTLVGLDVMRDIAQRRGLKPTALDSNQVAQAVGLRPTPSTCGCTVSSAAY
jgi:transcription-repair coupling factor (superfamily II helicase)